jgi:hypothetical protein
MKSRLPQTAGACCLVGIVLATTSITAGQVMDTLVKAKALYAEASYDEALTALKGNEAAEAYQYRALCFIALGKTQDAERAIESLINVAPSFSVSDADLSPRLVNLFTQTRRRVMPGVVKRLFTEARADFQAHNLASARDKFEKVLTLTHDPAMADAPDAVDLQLLVGSYIDIVKSSTPAPAPVLASNTIRTGAFSAPAVAPMPVVAPPSPAPAVMPAATPAVSTAAAAPLATPNTASSAAAATLPRAEASTRPELPARADSAVTPLTPAPVARPLVPAITVRQNIPSYEPLPGRPFQPMSGAVRVTIGVDGKVKAAVMEVPIDPRYDARLINAAKSWIFKPASLGGQPIQSEKIVQINISK